MRATGACFRKNIAALCRRTPQLTYAHTGPGTSFAPHAAGSGTRVIEAGSDVFNNHHLAFRWNAAARELWRRAPVPRVLSAEAARDVWAPARFDLRLRVGQHLDAWRRPRLLHALF